MQKYILFSAVLLSLSSVGLLSTVTKDLSQTESRLVLTTKAQVTSEVVQPEQGASHFLIPAEATTPKKLAALLSIFPVGQLPYAITDKEMKSILDQFVKKNSLIVSQETNAASGHQNMSQESEDPFGSAQYRENSERIRKFIKKEGWLGNFSRIPSLYIPLKSTETPGFYTLVYLHTRGFIINNANFGEYWAATFTKSGRLISDCAIGRLSPRELITFNIDQQLRTTATTYKVLWAEHNNTYQNNRITGFEFVQTKTIDLAQSSGKHRTKISVEKEVADTLPVPVRSGSSL